MIEYLTGADDKLFAQSLILLQSMEEAGGLVRVCDFGLTEGERRFLESLGRLAVADPPVPARLDHAWYHKGALASFARPDAEAVVWLDADMIVTADPRAEVEGIVSEMRAAGQSIATTQDVIELNLGDTIRRIGAAHENARPFLRKLEETGISLELPYVNSGFFVARERKLLEEWRRITFEFRPPHCLFEQNAFNIAVWLEPERVRLLDRRTWNICGRDLDSVEISDSGAGALCEGRPALVLHATDIGYSQTEIIAKTVVLPGCRLAARLKALRDPRLREIQIGLFERFVSRNQEALAEML